MFPLNLIRNCTFAFVMGAFFLTHAESIAQKSAPKGKVHILLVGLTEDKNIGKWVEYNLRNVQDMLMSCLPSHQIGGVRVLKGRALNAKSLLSTVDRMIVGPNDTLFMYYHGHGAYDPIFRTRDVSGGHYLDMPSGDLLRKDLWEHLRKQKARFTVLVTESCNVRVPARLAILTRSPTTLSRIPRESALLQSLLFNHRGVIDINASNKDEYSWNFGQGSFFTDTFVNVIEEAPFSSPTRVHWPQFVKVVSDRASSLYQNQRRNILANPGKHNTQIVKQFQGQLDQRVAIYHMSFIPDRADPVSPVRRDPSVYVWKLGTKGLRLNGSLLATHPKDDVRPRSHHRVYHVELRAGETYVIDMQSKELDAYLRVEDASGRELARDDDSGTGRDAKLEFHATRTGSYRIIATSYAPAIGRFTIGVRAN